MSIAADIKRIHFIGIGGIGMCGLAEYYLREGYYVSGSDVLESNITQRLKKMGAVVKIGHSSDYIDSSFDVVVYSSAVKSDNPELVKAEILNIKTMKRAEMLGEIVNDKFLIAVAGTHGKTTTTAMIGKLLIDAGFDPLIFVGGNVSLFDGGASRIGSGKYAVVEADEYDRSFLKLKPDISIITSIDVDHLDIYKDLDDIKQNFAAFIEGSKPGSRIIYCGDDGNVTSFIEKTDREKYSYGFSNDNYLKITDYHRSLKDITFNLVNATAEYKDIKLKVIGKHNVLNSTACFASGKLLNIDVNKIKKSIAGFKAVDRRLQLKYENKVIVFDDYAHHPKEIESSLKGLKEFYDNRRIISVFQPHLFSRTRDFYKEFAGALGIAGMVILLDIYPARELPIEGITSELINHELNKNKSNVIYSHSKDEVLKALKHEMKNNDVIVFQGAGDITLLCDKFIKDINKEN